MFPNGISQDAVLSPSLFNLFMSDIPSPQIPGVSIFSYADDLTILSQHPVVDTAADHLQQYIHRLEEWLTTNRMSVSPQKSSLTLITPFTWEYRAEPRVTLQGSPIPVLPSTKILGVTLDRGLTFRDHISEVSARARSRLNVMKALSSTTFGHSKESLTALYKQYVRPVLSYGSMAWAPDLAQSHMQVLQRTQNAALRIATGCVRSTPVAHLHAETKVLPIRDHLDMRSTQAYAAAADPGHPLHGLHHPVDTRRHLHSTPASHYGSLRTLIPPPPERRTELSWIHQYFVTRSLDGAPSNSLLGDSPPSISSDETMLPRADRVHLARLRCGHHPALLSYECRLRPETDPTCRWCGVTPESLSHLMQECRHLEAERTAVGITHTRDLWNIPSLSLDFLRAAGVVQDPN